MNSGAATLSEWLARLETFSPHDIDLGLDRVSAVLDALELGHDARVFHIGGTNGKGSSVAMLQALLLEAGATVGAYTSPHVIDYNERIVVNGVPVSDELIVAAFERVEAARGGTALTYFEFGTLTALVVFSEQKVDNVILEVGMGGRLDAVNAVEPDIGLITNVTLDHCDWLGSDIETIAAEKAGIMRSGKTIVFASKIVPETIVTCAADIDAELLLAGRDYDWVVDSGGRWEWQGRQCTLAGLEPPSLTGDFQIGNAAGVLALVEAAGLDELLDPVVVNRAFTGLSLAGRMQRIENGRRYLLDVAHNPAAAHVLAETIAADRGGDKTVAVIGLLDDKDAEGIVTLLSTVVDRWIAVGADNPRGVPPEELGRVIANISNTGCLVADSLFEALRFAREITDENDRILVTGSFYVVGPALQMLL
ncbi:MAG: folylpolyglutamate synthase/dihydrofolate synthase family protein [Woeseiaceae bacterium]|nr:folylpolyglutamate synthase/dihydrofolate synthase family protein [Woeseiaceae bacterium]